MKPALRQEPRTFMVGRHGDIAMQDWGQLLLQPDEQVTLVTEGGGQFDVARKAWGFYATPSLNGRLRSFGLRAVLVRNRQARYYLLLVEAGHEQEFHRYLAAEEQEVVCWMDNDADLARLGRPPEGE